MHNCFVVCKKMVPIIWPVPQECNILSCATMKEQDCKPSFAREDYCPIQFVTKYGTRYFEMHLADRTR